MKFLRSLLTRKLKPIVCTPRAGILDGIASAAANGKLRLPIGKVVPLNEAIPLLTKLESGRKLNGKGLVVIDT